MAVVALTCASRFWPGALLDRIVHTHVAHLEVKAMAEEWGVSVYDVLNAVVDCLVANVPATEHALRTRCCEANASRPSHVPAPNMARCSLAKHLHVYPDFNGNRSPHADPSLMGMVSGLTMGNSLLDLGRLYLAAVQSLAYGTREILQSLASKGVHIRRIVCCGGDTKNALFLRAHADATGCTLCTLCAARWAAPPVCS